MNNLRHASIRASSNAQFTSVARQAPGRPVWRLLEQSQRSRLHYFAPRNSANLSSYPAPLRSRFLPEEVRGLRAFHNGSRLREQKQRVKEERTGEEAGKKASSENSEAKDEPEPGKEKSKEEGEGEGDGKQEKKDAPPPPPHGDKSPWQVFTDTLRSEFKASKEWNESTKALSDGAHQFTENENVKRARQAYEATTGAVSSTTGKVLKNTAGAVGKGAAWTWDTSVVKGVRSTVNATANVIDTATKPIRETEAFKNVKNVIDDGSSSRYGGWVEKEERRKARELRELEQNGGKPREVLKEDPE